MIYRELFNDMKVVIYIYVYIYIIFCKEFTIQFQLILFNEIYYIRLNITGKHIKNIIQRLYKNSKRHRIIDIFKK